jgi:hypothetical protein
MYPKFYGKWSVGEKIMSTHIKVDSMAFSGHAGMLQNELTEACLKKAVKWVQEQKITSEVRINSIANVFLQKAEEEYERRLREDFPDPAYEPYIGSACLGSMRFFDKFREKIKTSITTPVAV